MSTLANELSQYENSIVLEGLCKFVTSLTEMHPNDWKFLQNMIQKYYPMKPTTVYRGTKVEIGSLPTILARKSFTLKKVDYIKSWSILRSTAFDFALGDLNPRSPEEHAPIGIMLKGTADAKNTIINMSDDNILAELKDLHEIFITEADQWMIDMAKQVEDALELMEGEKELIRWSEERSYRLCDDILKVTFLPQYMSDENWELLISVDPDSELAGEKYRKYGSPMIIDCMESSKLTLTLDNWVYD